MLNPVAEIRALSRRCFQRDLYRAIACGAKSFVESAGHDPQAGRLAGTQVRAGMHNNERHAKYSGAVELVDDGADRFLAYPRVGSREVEKVTTVGKDRQGVDPEPFDFACREWLAVPLHVVLEKNLDHTAAD